MLVSLNTARTKARDAKRKAQLDNIRALLDMYYAEHGYYPRESDHANGKVGEGGGLDTLLAPYISSGSLPHDPLGPNNSSYYYYYDGWQWCRKNGHSFMMAVLFARNLEGGHGNGSDFCDSWGGEGGAGGGNAWHIVLKDHLSSAEH